MAGQLTGIFSCPNSFSFSSPARHAEVSGKHEANGQ